MKIVIDDKIPFIKGALEEFADVVYLPGSEISAKDLQDANALLTRTRTQCNQDLLQGSKVKFIGSATIGIDHIDTEWCEKNGIHWTNAPGCNADSVEQYVTAALLFWGRVYDIILEKLTIGIVGVGEVGSRVAKSCRLLGMKVLLNDPPRERNEGSELFTSLDVIKKKADIISFHVPLNHSGQDKTFHMVDDVFIKSLHQEPMLINTCRGEVFNTPSILKGLTKNYITNPIIDCWENEPSIEEELLDYAIVGSPHIAGYSIDGKANGTQQVVRALGKFFKLPLDSWIPEDIPKPAKPIIMINGKGKSDQEIMTEAVSATYPIWKDNDRLRDEPETFEEQRGDYPVRREYHCYTISHKGIREELVNKLKELGFNIA